MKKLILSLLTMVSLAFAANAVTYMRVYTSDGQVVKYDMENVTEVDYEETSETPSQVVDGVTVSGKEGNYTYVDLGLPSGTKWATYNVGASKPTEYGDYFAWGDTKTKEEYRWKTYRWCKGSETSMIKYCTDSEYGTVDYKTVLYADDDAATANWGKKWRMPTAEEIDELIDGCTWKWIYDFNGSGVNGKLGTSKANGATIFLPAAGYRGDTNLSSVGDHGSYWSSSLSERSSDGAYYLSFINNVIRLDNFRYLGRSVRAVLR